MIAPNKVPTFHELGANMDKLATQMMKLGIQLEYVGGFSSHGKVGKAMQEAARSVKHRAALLKETPPTVIKSTPPKKKGCKAKRAKKA
jgi:hypothetical protein